VEFLPFLTFLAYHLQDCSHSGAVATPLEVNFMILKEGHGNTVVFVATDDTMVHYVVTIMYFLKVSQLMSSKHFSLIG